MKILRMGLLLSVMLFLASSLALAADFEWMKELNAQASIDLDGFKARLAARFQVGDASISAVLSKMGDPAGAYMAFRLAEMSKKPIDTVVEVCEKNRGKGWGVIAKNLGIKPGSPDFHALKRGHDLNGGERVKGKQKGKGKGRDRS